MSKGSGGTRGGKTNASDGRPPVLANTDANIQLVKSGLFRYAKEDRWNRNNEYQLGFNGEAQGVIDTVAKARLGFASDVANTVATHNYSISEKQAYVIAKAGLANGIVREHTIFKDHGNSPYATKWQEIKAANKAAKSAAAKASGKVAVSAVKTAGAKMGDYYAWLKTSSYKREYYSKAYSEASVAEFLRNRKK